MPGKGTRTKQQEQRNRKAWLHSLVPRPLSLRPGNKSCAFYVLRPNIFNANRDDPGSSVA